MKCLVLCVPLIVLTASSLPAEVRTWSSANGKFSIKAELVEVLDGKARLRKEDGRVISVPIAKLGSADRLFLKEQKNGAASVETVDAATPAAGVKSPAGLQISAKAQWESPPPPLVVEISILGKSAAEATSYGRLKLTKATTAEGVDMNMKKMQGFGPGSDPVEGFVKIDRNDKAVSFSPKQPKGGVCIPLIFERPKGNVTKTGPIEGSVELLTGGERKTVETANLASHYNKTIADASLKAADIEIKPKKQNNNIVIEVKGKQQNMVKMILIDKNGKPIKTMTSTFSMSGGPATHSFMPQGGSLPTDVGLRVTVVVGSKSIVVPFAVSGLKIEQYKKKNNVFPMSFGN